MSKVRALSLFDKRVPQRRFAPVRNDITENDETTEV